MGRGQIPVLGQMDLFIASGEFVSILGPSGCGKTTLLRMILGLEKNFDGQLTIGDQRIVGPGLDRGVVFQDPVLLPWFRVEQNISFALKDQAKNGHGLIRVRELIRTIGLEGWEKAWPKHLSGGMAQRVALARALVNTPDLLLLDEPFAALDSRTRSKMQDELLRVLNQQKTTTIMVTHDIDEALYLSDRVIVLSNSPATVKQVFPISISKPRSRSVRLYSDLRKALVDAFYA